MCERAVKLQPYINKWLQEEISQKPAGYRRTPLTSSETLEADYKDLQKLQLGAIEWQHLQAITKMLKDFKDATISLSENSNPQIPYIWLMYNRLFDFLDDITEELGEDVNHVDNTEWPDIVRAAASKGRDKLRKYYSRTGGEQGFLFNCATILDPTQKLTAYEVFITVAYHS